MPTLLYIYFEDKVEKDKEPCLQIYPIVVCFDVGSESYGIFFFFLSKCVTTINSCLLLLKGR